MRLGELPATELRVLLNGAGVDLHTGGFVNRLRSPLDQIAENLALLYGDFPCEPADGGFADFHVRIVSARGLRRYWRRQVLFHFDDRTPFKPLPLGQAVPMLEWGLNWCISSHAHHYLILHSAVVERNGCALILPAPPGSGKSTLCAGLVAGGWRLLSDELGLLDPATGRLAALARPINLKNRSIDIVRERAPDIPFSPPFHDTAKGTVALMRPPSDSVARSLETARPAWIIAGRYEEGVKTQFSAYGKGRMFMHVAATAFNYTLLARTGFQALGTLIDNCECYQLNYSRLDEAIDRINSLAPPAGVGSC